MEAITEQEIRYFRFIAGGAQDPRPAGNPLEKRFARCEGCNVIVHYLPALGAWVDDSGRYHTGHVLEFPRELEVGG